MPIHVPKRQSKRRRHWFLYLIIFIVAAGASSYALMSATNSPAKTTSVSGLTRQVAASKPRSTACSGNQLSKLILVSISKRRTYACAGSTMLLSTPVITGNENLASDLTPVGTYHILVKQRDVKLIGCDTDQPNVCWNDFVNYDMIFLYNQYGHYDLHDATWRTSSDFGNISPYSSSASHGCVETPLAAMSWLYNWTSVGTTVRIVS